MQNKKQNQTFQQDNMVFSGKPPISDWVRNSWCCHGMNIDDTAAFVGTGPLGQDVSVIEASDPIFLTELSQRAHIYVIPFLGSHNALCSPLGAGGGSLCSQYPAWDKCSSGGLERPTWRWLFSPDIPKNTVVVPTIGQPGCCLVVAVLSCLTPLPLVTVV